MFFDGTFTTPRLQHPEGVAIGPDGWIWCGSENGQILRIAPDASTHRGGGQHRRLHARARLRRRPRAVRLRPEERGRVPARSADAGSLARFTPPGIRIPNFPVVDVRRNRLLVSDSHAFGTPGPGIWSYDLDYRRGRALVRRHDEFRQRLRADAGRRRAAGLRDLRPPGHPHPDLGRTVAPGRATPFAADLPGLPDGIAIADDGTVFVGCYEPSRVLRIPAAGGAARGLYRGPDRASLRASDQHRVRRALRSTRPISAAGTSPASTRTCPARRARGGHAGVAAHDGPASRPHLGSSARLQCAGGGGARRRARRADRNGTSSRSRASSPPRSAISRPATTSWWSIIRISARPWRSTAFSRSKSVFAPTRSRAGAPQASAPRSRATVARPALGAAARRRHAGSGLPARPASGTRRAAGMMFSR